MILNINMKVCITSVKICMDFKSYEIQEKSIFWQSTDKYFKLPQSRCRKSVAFPVPAALFFVQNFEESCNVRLRAYLYIFKITTAGACILLMLCRHAIPTVARSTCLCESLEHLRLEVPFSVFPQLPNYLFKRSFFPGLLWIIHQSSNKVQL